MVMVILSGGHHDLEEIGEAMLGRFGCKILAEIGDIGGSKVRNSMVLARFFPGSKWVDNEIDNRYSR